MSARSSVAIVMVKELFDAFIHQVNIGSSNGADELRTVLTGSAIAFNDGDNVKLLLSNVEFYHAEQALISSLTALPEESYGLIILNDSDDFTADVYGSPYDFDLGYSTEIDDAQDIGRTLFYALESATQIEIANEIIFGLDVMEEPAKNVIMDVFENYMSSDGRYSLLHGFDRQALDDKVKALATIDLAALISDSPSMGQ